MNFIYRTETANIITPSRGRLRRNDGRFEMSFEPIIDRVAPLDVKLICMLPHQVFGKISGKAILDDGTVIEVKDKVVFAERVHNKW